MLSIEQCRRLLGSQADDMSDEQIAEMRDTLAAFSRIGIEDYLREHGRVSDNNTQQ